jgi:hypothetical protein
MNKWQKSADDWSAANVRNWPITGLPELRFAVCSDPSVKRIISGDGISRAPAKLGIA